LDLIAIGTQTAESIAQNQFLVEFKIKWILSTFLIILLLDSLHFKFNDKRNNQFRMIRM
jgi:hypothetical protein